VKSFTMNTNRSNLHFLAVLIVTLSLVGPVVADEDLYDFEMVVFERPGGGADEFWPAEPGEPDREAAATRLESLPGGPKVLGPEAYTLKKKGLIVHEHIAWRQAPPDRNSSRWYSIGSARLNGLVRVTRGRFLHLETDLVLNDANTWHPIASSCDAACAAGSCTMSITPNWEYSSRPNAINRCQAPRVLNRHPTASQSRRNPLPRRGPADYPPAIGFPPR